MSEPTREEVLGPKRQRSGHAGRPHKAQILNELVELFGCHRKAARRALRPKPAPAAPFVLNFWCNRVTPLLSNRSVFRPGLR